MTKFKAGDLTTSLLVKAILKSPIKVALWLVAYLAAVMALPALSSSQVYIKGPSNPGPPGQCPVPAIIGSSVGEVARRFVAANNGVTTTECWQTCNNPVALLSVDEQNLSFRVASNCTGGSYTHTVTTSPDPKQENCPATSNPISILNGNKMLKETDLSFGDDLLRFERFYTSLFDLFESNVMGLKWGHSYSKRIIFVGSDGSSGQASNPFIYVARENGQAYSYEYLQGEWVTDPDVRYKLSDLVDGQEHIGWMLESANGLREAYDSEGKLSMMEDLAGNRVILKYDLEVGQQGDGDPKTLDMVENSHGRRLTFSYDGAMRVSSVKDPDGDEIFYEYNTNNLLSKATYPGGEVINYHYEIPEKPHLLTGKSDADNTSLITWQYNADGLAFASEKNSGVQREVVDYSYVDDPLQPRVTVTNALGKATTYYFTTILGARKVVRVEGHPTDNCVGANRFYSYHSNGLVETTTNWDGITTRYFYNSRGLEITRVEAEGSLEERTITTEWHPTLNLRTKVTEQGQETIYEYDSEGRLLTRTVNIAGPSQGNGGGEDGDTDGDGMADSWEIAHFGDLDQNASTDFDGDGYLDIDEYRLGMNPTDNTVDSDADGVPDIWELVEYGDLSASNSNFYTTFVTQGGAVIENNYDVITNGDALDAARSIQSIYDKTYVEVDVDQYQMVGITRGGTLFDWYQGAANSAYYYISNGDLYGSASGTGGAGDVKSGVIGMAIDPAEKRFWIREKDGSWLSGDPETGAGGITLVPSASDVYLAINNGGGNTGVQSAVVNVGQTIFQHSVPNGFLSGIYTADTDFDHMIDAWEIYWFGGLAQGLTTDLDGDGLTDLDEFKLGFNPTVATPASYSKLDEASKHSAITLLNNDLTATNETNAWAAVKADSRLPMEGKTYWEVQIGAESAVVGMASDLEINNFVGSTVSGYGWSSENGNLFNNSLVSAQLSAFSLGDRLMFAYDAIEGKLWLGLNGLWSGNPATGIEPAFSSISGKQFPAVALKAGGNVSYAFERADFEFPVPVGYLPSFSGGAGPQGPFYETQGNATISADEKQVTTYNNADDAARTSFPITSKTYVELVLNSYNMVGVASENTPFSWHTGPANSAYVYLANGSLYGSATGTGGNTGMTGGVAGMAIDPTAKRFWLRKVGGTWLNGDPVTGTGGVSFANLSGSTVRLAINNGGAGTGTLTATVNLGQDAFVYPIPSGYESEL